MAVCDGGVARRGLIALIASVALAAVIAPPATAAPPGWKVGGAPAHSLEALPEGKTTTAGRVIGVGETGGERVQIDAYGWNPPTELVADEGSAACAFVEFAPEPHYPWYMSCFFPEWVKRPVRIETVIVEEGGRNATMIAGTVAPDVTKVVVSLTDPRGKGRPEARAIVAQVDGTLLRQLGQPVPFGYFFAKLPQVKGRRPVAVAYGAHGRKLGSTEGFDPMLD
jgi:hypothetical protein